MLSDEVLQEGLSAKILLPWREKNILNETGNYIDGAMERFGDLVCHAYRPGIMTYIVHCANNFPAVAAELLEARKVAAARAGADPAVRNLLLYEFGTTEPELLKSEIAALRQRVKELEDQRAGLLADYKSLMPNRG